MGFFKFIFILQSYLLLIFIYLVNHSITVGKILKETKLAYGQKYWLDIPNWVSYAIYLSFILVSTKLMLKWLHLLKDDANIRSNNIDKIYPASESFLPTFFAYIFLGLSINNWTSLFCIYAALA